MNRTEKIIIGVSHFFRLTLVIAVFLSAFEAQWITFFLSLLTLFFTFLPAIIERNYKITLPLEFEFIIIFFIYGTLFLGEVGDYYNKFWWWDILLHTLSGCILGTIGFLFVYLLNKNKKLDVYLGPAFVAIFSFTFALSIGALWEIFEFAMDSFFGLNMQSTGLVDTMWDLIVDSLGALLIAIGGYYYVRKIRTPIFYNLINKFVHLNNKK